MVMTPLELDKRDFRKAVRGYSEEEVEFFLSQVRGDYETLYTENQDLRVRLDDYEQNLGKYRALEHTLNNTLIIAQQTAEDLKHNAEKAAELILEEAKLKAQQRIHEAEAVVRKLELQKEDLLKRITELKIRLRAFLRAQLDMLEDTIDEEENLPQSTIPKEQAVPTQVDTEDVEVVETFETQESQEPQIVEETSESNVEYAEVATEEEPNS